MSSHVIRRSRAIEAAFGPGWDVRTQGPIGLDDESEPEPDVAVVPGSAFGPSGAGHVRACYATAYEEIVEAMDRTQRFVERRRAAAASA